MPVVYDRVFQIKVKHGFAKSKSNVLRKVYRKKMHVCIQVMTKMEALQPMIRKSVTEKESNILKGLKVKENEKETSHEKKISTKLNEKLADW